MRALLKLLVVLTGATGVTLAIVATAADGSGANSVSPTSVIQSSTGNTLTFTFTTAETMNSGEISINVPSGWSSPQGTAGTAGYTAAASSAGTIANVLDNADSAAGWGAGSACSGGIALDTAMKQEGSGSIRCINGNEGNNDRWFKVQSVQDWSSYTKIAFWINSSSAITAGRLNFAYDDASNLATPIEEISAGAVSANTWTYVVLTFGNTTRTAVRSFGFVIKHATALDNVTVRVDDFLIGPGSPTFPGGGDIRARLLQLANTQTATVTYGSGGGASGATAPSITGNYTFTTQSRVSDAGTLTSIAFSPTVMVETPDITAPAAVSNLAASNPTGSTIDLSWTAPGDDNNTGTAASYDIRYSTSPITEGNFSSATQVTGEPAPQAAGTSQSMTVSGLSSATTYYFAMKTSDEVPNTSAISNVPSLSTTAAPDTTAPAAVSDLTLSNPTSSTITLTWTASGDDGSSGTAASYDIRYSTSPITEGNFSSATQVTGEPAPQAAGSTETMVVSGLSANTTYYFALKTSDEAPNTSAISNVPSLSTTALILDQTNFWFRDDDGSESTATGFGSGDVNKNTNITEVAAGSNFRLRFSVKATGSGGTLTPRVEFKEGSGGCTLGTWTSISSSGTFSLQLSANFADGNPTTQQISTGQFTAGQMLESSNPGSAVTVPQNRSTEYEWSLKASASLPPDNTYTFRATDNGAALNEYSQCPTLASQSSTPPPTNVLWNQSDFRFRDDDGNEITATGWGPADAAKNAGVDIDDESDYNRQKNFRLRIAFRAQQDSGTIVPRLEFKRGKTADCSAETDNQGNAWQVVTSSRNERFVLRDSDNFANQTPTTQQVTGGLNFVSGLMLDTQNPAPSKTLTQNQKTEYEWALEDVGGFVKGSSYAFRITNNGTALGVYGNCPFLSFPGGESAGVAPTTVSFSGEAYPGARVTIVTREHFQEIPIKQDLVTSPRGDFEIEFIGVLQGAQSYGLVIKDKEGRLAQTKTYNIDTVSNSVTDKNVFASPTIGFSRLAVTKGDLLAVLGQAAPGNIVEIEIDRLRAIEKIANDSGDYKILISTADLRFGNYTARARQIDKNGRASDFSPQKSFTVSRLTAPQTDFNNDGIINISDWSIFLSRWQSKDAELKQRIDLNNDGKIDISDFSVFIRTFRK